MSEIMIATENLSKKYGNKTVVRDVSLTVERGTIVGLVGKNGAGKTTLIRVLTGLAKPTNGTFSILPGQERKDTDVAAIVERPSIYLDLTAKDNLTAQSKLLGIAIDNEYLDQTLKMVGLDPTSKKKAKNFSLGMKQRLAIAMTLVGKPKLLILDEPTNGLDPEGIHDMRTVFMKLCNEYGATLLISSHILSELEKIATDYLFMDKGRILKRVSAKEVENMNDKCLKITVDNIEKATAVLSELGRTEKISDDCLRLYGETPSTEVILTLAKNGVTATNITTESGDIEEYFIKLLNDSHEGGRNA